MNIEKVFSIACQNYNAGDLVKAAQGFKRILNKKPKHPAANHLFGVISHLNGKYDIAVQYIKRSLNAEPHNAEAHYNLGNSFMRLGLTDKAMTHLKQAVKIDPMFVNALGALGAYYERSNNLEEADKYIQQAIKIEPHNPLINLHKSVLLRRNGKVEDAIQILEKFTARNISNKNVLEDMLFELGKLYDKQRNSEKSFHYFELGNNLQQQNTTQVDKNKFISELDNINNNITSDWIVSWSDINENQDQCPLIFLVGFPRSGTTLMDQILDSHPDIQVMEEKEALLDVVNEINNMPDGYPLAIGKLNTNEIQRLRNIYFNNVGQSIVRRENSILVDKFPLNIRHIPLIIRLFPDVKIILALRHPCDVVLSNFMQHYSINMAMACFLNIEDTARIYSQVMSLWEKYVDIIPMDFHSIKYENLVENFEETAKKLFEFLGLDWTDNILEFNEHAKNRGFINTPSYESVTKPIYQDSKYRWKNYEDQLQPIFKHLEHFIQEFGY